MFKRIFICKGLLWKAVSKLCKSSSSSIHLNQGSAKYGPRATIRPTTQYIRTARDKLIGPRAVLCRPLI